MLPPLMAAGRRALLRRLVGCSLLHAASALATALLVGRLLGVTPDRLGWWVAATVLAVTAVGATRYAERVLAERLGQDYVHELRGRLVSSALGGEGNPSLGITVARTTNDLTSIRNWVAQGIAPLVAAIPLVVGSVVVLALLDWHLAVATLIPLIVLGVVLALVARRAYARARVLRRRRGRLASRLSDTLHARDGILAAAGEHRERRRIDHDSRRVVEAAVARSRTAGVLQATALTTAAAMAALVAIAGRTAGVGPGDVATALTIAGVLAAPLAETGRIVEFRQNFRAARRIIAPRVAPVPDPPAPAQAVRQVPAGRDTLHVRGRTTAGSTCTFSARTGDRIRLVAADPSEVSTVLRSLAAPSPDDDLQIVVDGWNHVALEPRRRRELVGLAARETPLERGSVGRAVRYRRPDLDPSHATATLVRVGLDDTVAGLDEGERTELRRGGEPLTPADRARLRLARAVIGDPPLLLLDHLDADLDQPGREMLRRVVEEHPGVVVFASDAPERVTGTYRTLELT